MTITDEDKVKLHTFWISNNFQDLDKFNKILTQYCPEKNKIVIGMESIGVYHIPLLSHLNNNYPNVILIQPKRIKAHRKSMGYEVKNDAICSLVMADFIAERGVKNNIFPVKYPKLRELCRFRWKLVRYQTQMKNRLKAIMHRVFPEYQYVFRDISSKTSLAILNFCCEPRLIKKYSADKFFRKVINLESRLHKDSIRKTYQAAEKSFGILEETNYFQDEVKSLIAAFKHTEIQLQAVEQSIETEFNAIDNSLKQIRGLGNMMAASIIAESEDINFFQK